MKSGSVIEGIVAFTAHHTANVNITFIVGSQHWSSALPIDTSCHQFCGYPQSVLMQNAAQQPPWEGLVVECVWQSSNVQDIWFVMLCTKCSPNISISPSIACSSVAPMRVTCNYGNSKKKQQSKNFTQKINKSRKERMSKWTRTNRSKTDSIWCPGHAWRRPGDSLGPRWPFRAGFQTQPKIDENIEGLWDAPEASREAPGDSEGPKKSFENHCVAEKLLSNRPFFINFRAQYLFSCFLSDLTSICHGKSMRNRWDKTYYFFTAVYVFLKVATLTKHLIWRCEGYFSIFPFLHAF